MKRFAILVAVLAFTYAALPASADTVNLVPSGSYAYSYVYTFPSSSPYAWSYGTGIGLVETANYTSGGYDYFEAWGGTTTGSVTKFSEDYVYLNGSWYEAAGNWTFNSKTDVFSGNFSGPQGKTWFFTETFGTPGSYGTYDYSGYYSIQEGSVLSGSMTTTPEPGSLALLGTGLCGIGGLLRRKLVRR